MNNLPARLKRMHRRGKKRVGKSKKRGQDPVCERGLADGAKFFKKLLTLLPRGRSLEQDQGHS
jgi:hypothetical protein